MTTDQTATLAAAIRDALPEIVREAFDAEQTNDEELLTFGTEQAFIIHLSNGAAFQINLTQRAAGKIACEDCDELFHEDELAAGRCPACLEEDEYAYAGGEAQYRADRQADYDASIR